MHYTYSPPPFTLGLAWTPQPEAQYYQEAFRVTITCGARGNTFLDPFTIPPPHPDWTALHTWLTAQAGSGAGSEGWWTALINQCPGGTIPPSVPGLAYVLMERVRQCWPTFHRYPDSYITVTLANERGTWTASTTSPAAVP